LRGFAFGGDKHRMTMRAVLDLRRLLVLRAVAQHGSLAAAARALGYSQPAVTPSAALRPRPASG
jgi:Bacterial regulatory helix-turn-helix protein, lysR family